MAEPTEPNPLPRQSSPDLQVETPVVPDAEQDSASMLERLKSIDYNDHKAALVGIGAAAVVLGVGVYRLSRRHGGKEISISFGDRRMEKEGVISLVERTRQGGAAVSAAVSAAALAGLGKTKDVFGMDDVDGKPEVTYPLERDSDTAKHAKTLRKFGGWLVDIYDRRQKPKDDSIE